MREDVSDKHFCDKDCYSICEKKYNELRVRVKAKDDALHYASGIIKILGRKHTTGLVGEGIDDALRQIQRAIQDLP